MEKVLNQMPNSQGIKADKVLEVNANHEVFKVLKDAYEHDKDKLSLYTNLLYNQALLIEGLSISDPVEFTNGNLFGQKMESKSPTQQTPTAKLQQNTSKMSL